jgi:uncharacterized protein
MSRYHFCIPLFCVLLLAGCAQLPGGYRLYQEQSSPWVIEQNNTRLQNVSTLIQTGKGSAAKQEADLIKPSELTPPQLAQYNLLFAQILLSFGEAEQAIKKLVTTESGQLGISDKIKFFQSQAFAYSLTGNLLEHAKARINLDAFLTKPDERKKNQAIIMETLGLLPDSIAQNQQNLTPGLPEWLSISKTLALRNQDPAKFNSSLASWRATNPEHPANIFLAGVEKMSEDSGDKPKTIALLLPESGPFLDAAKAVKAGFLAAHSGDNSDGSKPELHFYDTEKSKPAESYKKAVKEGATLVIGPLNKESIQNLAGSRALQIPVLALNHVPGLRKQNLYQFALSPMDDVSEITQKAALDGHKKAVLFVPDNDQGKRVASFFREYWQALNGTILKKQTYDPTKNDFSSLVKSLKSPVTVGGQYRNPAAQAALEGQELADVVFLSAYTKEGRSINLQLNQVSKLPVYALPSIYSGIPDPLSDSPLEGIVFCDTPWLFNGSYSGELSMMALSNILNQFPTSYIRLVAMGIDAYHLASRLAALSTTPYAGATGNLSLASGNRIKRSLVCAKFVKGQPEPIGFSHSPSASDYTGNKTSNVSPAADQ